MKQVVVIGLGNFGNYIAKELYIKGFDVIALDKDAQKVQEIQADVTQAIVADSTDISALKAVGIDNADMVLVCMGSSLSDSILTALNVKDLGVRRIYAKAKTSSHGRILEKLGVSEVLFPERDLALNVARKMANPNMLDFIPFIEGYTIVELAPIQVFIGKKLKEMDLINKFGVQVIAVKDVITDHVNIIPTGEYLVKDSDVLVLLGKKEDIDRLKDGE